MSLYRKTLKLLGVKPGSVTPFALLNDIKDKVDYCVMMSPTMDTRREWKKVVPCFMIHDTVDKDRISDLLNKQNAELQNNTHHVEQVLIEEASAEVLMPIEIGDYTDFYSSREHATNVGTMFRDPNNALLPNWLHIPVGYHGRSSSVIPSGQNIHRPKGQTKPNEDQGPVFGPSKMIDFELEMAFVTFDGKPCLLIVIKSLLGVYLRR